MHNLFMIKKKSYLTLVEVASFEHSSFFDGWLDILHETSQGHSFHIFSYFFARDSVLFS